MENVFKKIIVLMCVSVIFVVSISIIFFKGELANAKQISDVDNLTGQRIGTMTAYEGDYILSDRDDLTLLRFDSEADCLVALCYKQVDALAVTENMAEYVLNLSTGLRINEKPIATTGFASVFPEDTQLLHDYNDFVEEFKKSEEYVQYCAKVDNQEFYDGSDILEETGTGKTINVGYAQDYVPASFYDTVNKRPNGFEVEIAIRFANARNYKINWVEVTETTAYPFLLGGDIDMACLAYSEIYRREFEATTYYDMAVSYKDTDVVLLEVEDYDNLSLNGFIESEGE